MEDYEILGELGRGTFGVVYKVQKNNQTFVMKKINLSHMKQKHQKEALKEASILKRVEHPHIIKYFTSFMDNQVLCIVMEYAEGGDLHKLLKIMKERKKYLPERDIWQIGWELCSAVKYLHQHNIIHRDIKCLNVFLTKDRHVKLGDLGVSKIVQSAHHLNATRVGTPLYLSPEIVKQQPYDFKVDIWAIGCVMYHIACLEAPFKGDNLIALGNEIVSKKPKPLASCYSPKLQTLITKCLEKKPIDRPSIYEVLYFFPQHREDLQFSNNENISMISTKDTLQTNLKENLKKNNILTPATSREKPLQQESEELPKVIEPKETEKPQEILPNEVQNEQIKMRPKSAAIHNLMPVKPIIPIHEEIRVLPVEYKIMRPKTAQPKEADQPAQKIQLNPKLFIQRPKPQAQRTGIKISIRPSSAYPFIKKDQNQEDINHYLPKQQKLSTSGFKPFPIKSQIVQISQFPFNQNNLPQIKRSESLLQQSQKQWLTFEKEKPEIIIRQQTVQVKKRKLTIKDLESV